MQSNLPRSYVSTVNWYHDVDDSSTKVKISDSSRMLELRQKVLSGIGTDYFESLAASEFSQTKKNIFLNQQKIPKLMKKRIKTNFGAKIRNL